MDSAEIHFYRNHFLEVSIWYSKNKKGCANSKLKRLDSVFPNMLAFDTGHKRKYIQRKRLDT